MKEIVKDSEKMFALELDDVGQYVISAMCGGVGMYEVRIVLDSEEVERFHAEGTEYIEELAYEIAKNASKYKHRYLK